MRDDETIRLIGYPVVITIPGEADDEYERSSTSFWAGSYYARRPSDPPCVIHGGEVYHGYAMCEVDCPLSRNIHDIYLLYKNDVLYALTDWFNHDDFQDFSGIKRIQDLSTYSKLQAVAQLLFKKIEYLYEELDKKENCREY